MLTSDKIESRVVLKQLCDMLQWANGSDADGSDRPAAYAAQDSVYGHVTAAIAAIVWEEADVEYALLDLNYGGNGSWFDDLLYAIDEHRPIGAERLPNGAIVIDRRECDRKHFVLALHRREWVTWRIDPEDDATFCGRYFPFSQRAEAEANFRSREH